MRSPVWFLCLVVTIWQAADARSDDRTKGLVAKAVPAPFRDLELAWTFAVSPDGKRLVTGSRPWEVNKGEVRWWDLLTGKEEKPGFTVRRPVKSVAFSPKGTFIAAGGEYDKIRVWECKTGKLKAELGDDEYSHALAFQPTDEKFLASQNEETIKLWDIGQGKMIATLKGHTETIEALVFSSDGRLLASGGWDKVIVLWDVKERKEVGRLCGHSKDVEGLAFCPKSGRLASASRDGTVKIWDPVEKKQIASYAGPVDGVLCVAFSGDGGLLVAGGLDRDPGFGEVRVWETTNGKLLTRFEAHDWGGTTSIVFTPDDKFLVTLGLEKGPPERKVPKLWKLEPK